MIRGAGGEVYRPRWLLARAPPHFTLDTKDAIILPTKAADDHRPRGTAVLAIAAGVAAWPARVRAFLPARPDPQHAPHLRRAGSSALIHVGEKRGLSDAEQSYMFPPNRRPETRGWLLSRALRQPTTWARMGYGILWSIAILFWGNRLMDMPAWTLSSLLAFMRSYGVEVGLWIGGSLIGLGAAYLFWETYHSLRDRAQARRNTLHMWRERWFGQGKIILDESSRMKAMALSPLLSTLQPPQRLELARAMAVRRHGPWKTLWEYENLPTQVALIVSGKVALRRELPTGRSVQAQVLTEGDIIGLHDLADPKFPNYLLRSLTPVTLLTHGPGDRRGARRQEGPAGDADGHAPQDALPAADLALPELAPAGHQPLRAPVHDHRLPAGKRHPERGPDRRGFLHHLPGQRPGHPEDPPARGHPRRRVLRRDRPHAEQLPQRHASRPTRAPAA
jgi:hypothetical protein